MLRYLVVEISGKQFKVLPDLPLLVDYLGDIKTLENSKVLLKAEDEDIEVGTPYLNDKLTFSVLENLQGKKVRVATYKSKANTRKVVGFRKKMSKIALANDTKSTRKREKE